MCVSGNKNFLYYFFNAGKHELAGSELGLEHLLIFASLVSSNGEKG